MKKDLQKIARTELLKTRHKWNTERQSWIETNAVLAVFRGKLKFIRK